MTQEIVKRKTLAAYAADLEEISTEVEEETGKITDQMLARFDGAQVALAGKVDSWIGYMGAVKALIVEAKERKERADKAKKAFESLDKRLKDYVKYVMESTPDIPFKGTEGSLSLQRNPEALELDFETADKTIYRALDPSLLDLEPTLNAYVKAITAYVIDTERLKADLKAGITVPWARLTRGKNVRIR